MRVTATIAAIASCAVIYTAQTATADALSPAELANEDSPTLLKDIALEDEQNNQETAKDSQKEEQSQKPQKYTVKRGDTLTSIAKEHETTWKRLFYKNKDIAHPDKLKVDQKLVIPKDDEELKKRDIPTLQVQEEAQEETQQQPREETASNSNDTSATSSAPAASQRTATRSQSVARGSSSGNRYVYGYCTWYVKNRRPDLPNNLGNAATWASRAAAQGLPTGSTPRAGAVGQQGNHVVYVESVNGDGTVTISEMNWSGWNTTSTRTVAANSFRYIY